MSRAERDPVFDEPAEPSGGRSHVEQLFREHNDALLKFLRVRLHSDADAREAAQEAYIRLLQLDAPDQISFLRAYLFRIAANVATDLLRRRAVRTRAEIAEPDEIPANQERAFQARQQLHAIQALLAQLPPNCREAFVRSRCDGWSTSQIAGHLGVSDRMVRLYLVRALEHIEAGLDDAGAGR